MAVVVMKEEVINAMLDQGQVGGFTEIVSLEETVKTIVAHTADLELDFELYS